MKSPILGATTIRCAGAVSGDLAKLSKQKGDQRKASPVQENEQPKQGSPGDPYNPPATAMGVPIQLS